MRAVIETSVVVRAVIKPRSTVDPVLRRLAQGDFVLVYSRPILQELVPRSAGETG